MAHADEWWTQASDFSSGSYTDPAGERCWGRSEKKWSISIKLMLFNFGTSGSRCVETAQIVESAPVKVGGPDLLPSPESWNGPRWESCGLPLYYVPPLCLKYPVDFQLEGLHLPRAAWVCQRCVHPVFLPPWFRDRPSRGLCACALKEMTMGRRHLCKLLSINDTQTFHLKKKKKKTNQNPETEYQTKSFWPTEKLPPLLFNWLKIDFFSWLKIWVSGVQQSDVIFKDFTLYKNIGYIHCAAHYIFVTYFIPSSFYLLIHFTYLVPPSNTQNCFYWIKSLVKYHFSYFNAIIRNTSGKKCIKSIKWCCKRHLLIILYNTYIGKPWETHIRYEYWG